MTSQGRLSTLSWILTVVEMSALISHVPDVAALALLLIWAPLLFEWFRRAPDRLSIASIYLAGTTPALSIIIQPAAEHGITAVTPLHDKVSQAATMAAFGLLVISLLIRGLDHRINGPRGWLLLYQLVLVTAGTLAGSFDFRWLAAPALLLVASQNLNAEMTTRHLRYATRVITLGSLTLLVTNSAQVLFTENGRRIFGIDQLSGATAHPNVLGPTAALALALELTPHRQRKSVTAIAAATACVLLAQSRAGWCCAGMVIICIGLQRSLSRLALRSIMGAGAALLIWYFDQIDMIHLLDGRAEVWRVTLTLFSRHPWLIGGGPTVYADHDSIASRAASVTGQAHNQFLGALASGGAIGLTVMLTFLISLIAQAHRQWQVHRWLPTAGVSMLLLDGMVESSAAAARTTPAFFVLAITILTMTDNSKYPDLKGPGYSDGGSSDVHHGALNKKLERSQSEHESVQRG